MLKHLKISKTLINKAKSAGKTTLGPVQNVTLDFAKILRFIDFNFGIG
jgi:hypothetical protein